VLLADPSIDASDPWTVTSPVSFPTPTPATMVSLCPLSFSHIDHGISILPLFKYNLMQLRFLLRNLQRFHNEHLVLVLKLKNTSWLVMSGVRKYQTP
jgi:hypothetical protein